MNHFIREFIPLLAISTFFGFIHILFFDVSLPLWLLWNIFLAAVPYFLSLLFLKVRGVLNQVCIFILWILFLPNSFYVVTDFVHIHFARETLYFDILFITSVFIISTFMGMRSVYMMHRFFEMKWKGVMLWIGVLGVFLISMLWVYIGRFLRLNSWDILLHPFHFLREIGYCIISNGNFLVIHDGSRLKENATFSIGVLGLWQFILLYWVFFFILYIYFFLIWKRVKVNP